MVSRTFSLCMIGMLLLFPTAGTSHDQQQTASHPCSNPESSQFDFWLGEWDVRWTDKEGKTLHGSNNIKKTLGGCVIAEDFDNPNTGFTGMSVSVYNPHTRKWQQTWVDNAGGYLDFVGEFADGRMVLQRRTSRDGNDFIQRMVWYNIGKDNLDWNWERSDDGGKTWTLLWKIQYTRSR